MMRQFADVPAVREQVPVLVGLVGPSGSGKTYSALRIATGVQQITGGEIFVIDTEAKRSLHYADQFNFRHVEFVAPFGPLDYLQAIEYCVSKGAKVIVVDSMSHEHEGPGGVLEMHEEECDRLAAAWRKSKDAVKMAAWQKPKSERRRLINGMCQVQCSFVFCYRAKPKLKVIPGKQPQALGYMPIAGDEMVYEMTVSALLLPGSRGVPSWHPDEMGERAIVKLPIQFEEIFRDGRQLDERHGKELAMWASGAGAVVHDTPDIDKMKAELEACTSSEERKLWHQENADVLKTLPAGPKNMLRALYRSLDQEPDDGVTLFEPAQPVVAEPHGPGKVIMDTGAQRVRVLLDSGAEVQVARERVRSA